PRSGIESEQWDHLLDSLEGVMLNPLKDMWSWDLNGSGEFSVASARSVVRAIFRRVCIWWDVSYIALDSFGEWISWITNLRLPSKHQSILEGVCYGLWWFIWAFPNKKIFGVVPSSKANIFDDLVISSFFRIKPSFLDLFTSLTASSLVCKKLLAQARSFVVVARAPLGVPIVRDSLGGVRLITTNHGPNKATSYVDYEEPTAYKLLEYCRGLIYPSVGNQIYLSLINNVVSRFKL
nr:RNA-directed DNA polymerase, eukaryota, reverse transcriptase zinc-binding domain protein [Tanacetum cinerariifolium]